MPKDIIVGQPPHACRCERFGLFVAVLIVALACGYGLIRRAETGTTDARRASAEFDP